MYFCVIGTCIECSSYMIWVIIPLPQQQEEIEMQTINRVQLNFMIDRETDAKLKSTFPGLSQSAKIGVAIKHFFDDVESGRVTADEVLEEIQRVKDRKYGRI